VSVSEANGVSLVRTFVSVAMETGPFWVVLPKSWWIFGGGEKSGERKKSGPHNLQDVVLSHWLDDPGANENQFVSLFFIKKKH